jgi:hypothetical protein
VSLPWWVASAICPNRERQPIVAAAKRDGLLVAACVLFTALTALSGAPAYFFLVPAVGTGVRVTWVIAATRWLDRRAGWVWLPGLPATGPERWRRKMLLPSWAQWALVLLLLLGAAVAIVVELARG